MLQLHFKDKTYSLLPPSLSIGRNAKNQLVVPDARIPDFLLSFVGRDNAWRIVPLDSGAIISVNGVAITQPTQVQPGAELRFGEYCIYVSHCEQGLTTDSVNVNPGNRFCEAGFALLSQFKKSMADGPAQEAERLFKLPNMGTLTLGQIVPSLAADALGDSIVFTSEDDELWMNTAESVLVNGKQSYSCRLYSDDEIQCAGHIWLIQGPVHQARSPQELESDSQPLDYAQGKGVLFDESEPLDAAELEAFRDRLNDWLYQDRINSADCLSSRPSSTLGSEATATQVERTHTSAALLSADATRFKWSAAASSGMRSEPSQDSHSTGSHESPSSISGEYSERLCELKLHSGADSNKLFVVFRPNERLWVVWGERVAQFCTGRMGRVVLLIGLAWMTAYVLG